MRLAMKISMAINFKEYFLFFCYTDDYEQSFACGKGYVSVIFFILLIRKKTLENEDNISSTSLKIKVSLHLSV